MPVPARPTERSDARAASGGSHPATDGPPLGRRAPSGGGAPSALRGDRTRRILGIDPGLRITGFGVVDCDGRRLAYVASGVIRTGLGSAPTRLGVIARDLAHVLADYAPAEVVVERVFVNVNPTSTLLLGQARGAAIAAAALAGLPVHEYTPGQIKQAVVGGGRATKTQVQAMIMRLLALPGLPSPDAADALAAAVCHAHATSGAGAMLPAPSRKRGGRTTRRRSLP